MARTKTGDKGAQLRRAAQEELAEYGLASASVNRIAQRAGLSVGTLYRYYKNKDAIYCDAYLRLKRDLSDKMLNAATHETSSERKIRSALNSFSDHFLEQAQDVILLEAVANASILTAEDQQTVMQIDAELFKLINAGLEDGTLKQASPFAIATMLLSPLIHSARRAALSDSRQDSELIAEIQGLCWRSVALNDK
ncbi:MAG: TetR/AcrR family transcriptional regulator [Cognatishimia sp.]|uniref:TetR/AcrR family transcriptional regulator n=1 Tax=Cognatishimia sp. TaxID=2211648 RepID=UPI003B8C81F2